MRTAEVESYRPAPDVKTSVLKQPVLLPDTFLNPDFDADLKKDLKAFEQELAEDNLEFLINSLNLKKLI